MGLRDKMRRLERAVEEEMIVIPQQDGTVRRFPPGAGIEAFMNYMDRLGAGDDAPPEHPLIEAARNSSNPIWSHSFFAVEDPDEWVKPIPDLSEEWRLDDAGRFVRTLGAVAGRWLIRDYVFDAGC